MPPTARTQSARMIFYKFLDWWQNAPLYKSIWFFPLVMVVYLAAVLKNLITGEKK
jgi:hypothetical protein